MNNIVKFESNTAMANPSDLTKLGSSMAQHSTSGGGDDLLKLTKEGYWVYGADAIEPEEGSQWAINPSSFSHGWIAWDNGEIAGEVMASALGPMPEKPADGNKYDEQLACQLMCMTGDDKDKQVIYKTTSMGGKKAIGKLANAIATQAAENPDAVIPVVTLGVDSYQHKKYGKIYTPEIDIAEWIGNEAEAPEEKPSRGRSRNK